MKTQDHLEKIKAKCLANLALAEKRTPGKWRCDGYNVRQPGGRPVADVGPHHTPTSEYPRGYKSADEENGAYIAACAGAAEAGWRSTIAAIESVPLVNRGSAPSYTQREERLIATIIAAWPEETL